MVVLELFEGVIDILGFHVPVMVQQVQINHLNHKQCPDAKAAGKRPVGIRSTIKFFTSLSRPPYVTAWTSAYPPTLPLLEGYSIRDV